MDEKIAIAVCGGYNLQCNTHTFPKSIQDPPCSTIRFVLYYAITTAPISTTKGRAVRLLVNSHKYPAYLMKELELHFFAIDVKKEDRNCSWINVMMKK